MKYNIIILALALGCVSGVTASQWPYKALSELIKEADLVVIGSIDSDSGRTKPELPKISQAYVWNSKLTVKAVLKGSIDLGEIAIRWDEIRIDGVSEYKLKEDRIWILKTLRSDGQVTMFWTSGMPDTVLMTNKLSEVQDILKVTSTNKTSGTAKLIDPKH